MDKAADVVLSEIGGYLQLCDTAVIARVGNRYRAWMEREQCKARGWTLVVSDNRIARLLGGTPPVLDRLARNATSVSLESAVDAVIQSLSPSNIYSGLTHLLSCPRLTALDISGMQEEHLRYVPPILGPALVDLVLLPTHCPMQGMVHQDWLDKLRPEQDMRRLVCPSWSGGRIKWIGSLPRMLETLSIVHVNPKSQVTDFWIDGIIVKLPCLHALELHGMSAFNLSSHVDVFAHATLDRLVLSDFAGCRLEACKSTATATMWTNRAVHRATVMDWIVKWSTTAWPVRTLVLRHLQEGVAGCGDVYATLTTGPWSTSVQTLCLSIAHLLHFRDVHFVQHAVQKTQETVGMSPGSIQLLTLDVDVAGSTLEDVQKAIRAPVIAARHLILRSPTPEIRIAFATRPNTSFA